MVVDDDSADLFECITWYHKVILSWPILVSHGRSGTIGQDEVETTTFTIFFVILKANEGVNLSVYNTIIDLSFSLKNKHFFVSLDAYYI